MGKFNESMEAIFEVMPEEPAPLVPYNDTLPIISADQDKLEKDLDQDYKEIRDQYKRMIFKGTTAIDDLLAIASESEHPRAYEVVATLIKNVTEVSDKLLVLQKNMRDLKNIEGSGSKVTNKIEKAIFIGSTADLNKMLKENKPPE
jgi:hypothetical protein